MIKQNVVFVENKAGSLKRVTGILADNGINIYGFACFDAPEFAIFRMICNDPDKAEIVLNRSGYMNRITQAIVVDMKDQVGGLDPAHRGRRDRQRALDRRQRGRDDLDVEDRHEHAEAHQEEACPGRSRWAVGLLICPRAHGVLMRGQSETESARLSARIRIASTVRLSTVKINASTDRCRASGSSAISATTTA